MTKREMFTLIANAMASNTEVVEFCNHEIELLNRKASKSGSTKTQKENLVLVEAIFNALATLDSPVTISEFQSAVPEMAQYTNQKLSALFKKLVDAKRVVKIVDKKKSYFTVAESAQYLDREVAE